MAGELKPYISCCVGYTLDANHSFKGVGFYLNPSAGVVFLKQKNASFNIGIGYEHQAKQSYVTYYSDQQYQLAKLNHNNGSLSVVLGISF